MYCTECGGENDNDKQFCIHCGNRLSGNPVMKRKTDPAATGSSQPAMQSYQNKSVPQVRPWVRFVARIIDIWLTQILLLGIIIVFVIMLAILIPQSLPTIVNSSKNINPTLDLVITLMVSLLILAFIEPFFISNYGFTPGKWLMQTRVINPDGTNLTFSQAMNRSFAVYTRGFCIGIPVLFIITLLMESTKLENEGKTSWDAKGGYVVLHNEIGIPRTIAAIILLIVMRLIMMILSEKGG
jgi:uncharacterized RDD family membrane protein YckC